MYAVSISLGACNAFVAVMHQASPHPSPGSAASIKVVANVAGHRRTPVAAALTEQELLFGDNAVQVYPRKPQKVVPYLFPYAAAAAALTDALRSHDKEKEKVARQLLQSVEETSRIKYGSHCPIEEERAAAHGPAEKRRLGFYYEREEGEDVVEAFVSAEDLFVEFLNHLKEDVVDGACGLGAAAGGRTRGIALTVAAPRYAFPGAANRAVAWLREAVQASRFGGVCEHISVLFSDEACLLAVDSAVAGGGSPCFVLPPPAAAPVPCASLLIVDWGGHALALSQLRTVNGLLLRRQHGGEWAAPYLCSTASGGLFKGDTLSCFAAHRSCGGDSVDAILAECVAAQYILKNRRMFPKQLSAGNTNALMRRLNNFLDIQCDQRDAASVVDECIPARSMNRLRLSIEERKIALNTNPNANSVSVEVEAFYEGMDLQDGQTLSRNKFESALGSVHSLAGMFTDVLNEFTERFSKQLEDCPINYVLVAGGMHNMPAIVQMVRKAISQSNSASVCAGFDFSSLRFLDDLVAGKGIGADELAAVGACFHSSQIALLVLQQDKVKNELHKRNKKHNKVKRLSTIALQETEEALFKIRSSLSLESGGEDDEDDDDHTQVSLLKHSIYAFVGESAASRLVDLASQGVRTVELASNELCCLFSQGIPLPSRVVANYDVSAESLVLYLFSGVSEELNASDEHPVSLRVRPVYPKGVVIPLDGPVSLVLTLRCTHDGEGDERVSLAVATAQRGARQPSTFLTPHNTNEWADVFLY